MAKEIMEILNRAKIVDESIGTIAHEVNRQNISLFSLKLPHDRDHQELSTQIYARNGYFYQKLNFKVLDEKWRMYSTLVKSISELREYSSSRTKNFR